MAGMSAKRWATLIAFILGLACSVSFAQTTDELLKTLEPGIGYSKFKQWVSDNKVVFESFTKDQLTVRDTGLREGYSLHILVRFAEATTTLDADHR